VCDWIDYGGEDVAARYWTLDPIDGTKGFLRGDQYAVALALVVDGQVQIGVLGCPHLRDAYRPDFGGPGSLVIGVRGQGAWTTTIESPGDFTQLEVSRISDASQARILRSVESGHTNVGQIDQFALALGAQAEPVRLDSQAKYAVLAAGGGELYLRLLSPSRPDYREKIWDQAAGSLVLEEAGGRISDLSGKRLDFTPGRSLINNRGVLASNELLHSAAIQALRQVGA
jgi:3'(2'), 5'-bisphosphate nucleotidase